MQQVLLRADGEFLSRHSVEAALAVGFNFIIANKGCESYFDPDSWYRPYKRKDVEYNSCLYQPRGWQLPCRFVVMRIPKKTDSDRPIQQKLFDIDRYTCRIFCTNLVAILGECSYRYRNCEDMLKFFYEG